LARPRVTAEEPAYRDPVVVISETAMRQFLAGKVTFDQAQRQELIVIDADGQTAEALRTIWQAAYPDLGFSRFACT
jgi:hypothetical protein